MEKQENQIQSNWLLFLLFILFIHGKDTSKLNIQEISLMELDKKSKLLNRVKGYMNPQEQNIVNSAEIILQIIHSIKKLTDLQQIKTSEVKYSSLSLEDRKRNMLIDLSEFLEEEKKTLVHNAVDFDIKVKTLEKKLKEIQKLSEKDGEVNINSYIEILEPILADDVKEKIFGLKKLVSISKAINSFKSKEKINELDIIEIIQPFIHKDQQDSLMQMIQIFQVVNSMKDVDIKSESNNIEESPLKTSLEDEIHKDIKLEK